jgi:hypothetical protein
MVNYHDPAVVAQDYCAYTFAAKHTSSWSQLISFDSGIIEALATCVSALPLVPFALTAYRIIWRFISTWEFVTTLDYQWNVFRRHRFFRWTIWVGSDPKVWRWLWNTCSTSQQDFFPYQISPCASPARPYAP